MKNDMLQIYRGEDYVINDLIRIHQPTLGEIADFGEQRYFTVVHMLCATPTDCKYQLHLQGINWEEISDFDLFLFYAKSFQKEDTSLLLGSLDLSTYGRYLNQENGELCLYNPDTNSIIDASIHELMVSFLRKVHGLKRHVEISGNEFTHKALLEEAEEEFQLQKNKEYESSLMPLISTMLGMEGFGYNHNTVWDMKLLAFMDSVRRIPSIKNTDLLLQSGYSGFGIDLKKVNKKELNYFRDLD